MKDYERIYLLALLGAMYVIGTAAALANSYLPSSGMIKCLIALIGVIALAKIAHKFERAKH